MTQEERERQSNKEALKDVWKYYMIAFAGIAILWLASYVPNPLDTVLYVVGALMFFGGVFIVLYWDRKAKQKAMEQIRAEAAAEEVKAQRRSRRRRK